MLYFVFKQYRIEPFVDLNSQPKIPPTQILMSPSPKINTVPLAHTPSPSSINYQSVDPQNFSCPNDESYHELGQGSINMNAGDSNGEIKNAYICGYFKGNKANNNMDTCPKSNNLFYSNRLANPVKLTYGDEEVSLCGYAPITYYRLPNCNRARQEEIISDYKSGKLNLKKRHLILDNQNLYLQ